MPKDFGQDPSETQVRPGKKTIRSAREIKQGMLRRAFDGQSRYTPTEVISMISEASSRSRTMPADHQAALREISFGQARGVMMLNALARHEGSNVRYADTTPATAVPGPLTLQ